VAVGIGAAIEDVAIDAGHKSIAERIPVVIVGHLAADSIEVNAPAVKENPVQSRRIVGANRINKILKREIPAIQGGNQTIGGIISDADVVDISTRRVAESVVSKGTVGNKREYEAVSRIGDNIVGAIVRCLQDIDIREVVIKIAEVESIGCKNIYRCLASEN